MFPDAVIDRDGRAHIVYVHDPEAGSTTAEEGDVRYVTSARAPYAEWSAPVTVNDDGPGRAQGFASLAARRHGRSTVVEAVWEDTRLAPDLPPGAPQAQLYLYDIFHARLELGGNAVWSANVRVTDASSTQSQTSAAGRTAWPRTTAVSSSRRGSTGALRSRRRTPPPTSTAAASTPGRGAVRRTTHGVRHRPPTAGNLVADVGVVADLAGALRLTEGIAGLAVLRRGARRLRECTWRPPRRRSAPGVK